MHRVRRADVFTEAVPPVVFERYELEGDSEEHGHDFVELAVVTGGTGLHVSAGGERVVRRGSAVLLRPGDWHGYRECRGLVVHNAYVGPEVFRNELGWLPAEPRQSSFRLEPLALRVLEAGLGAGGPGPYAMRVGILLCVLGGTADAAQPDPAHPAVLAAARLLAGEIEHGWTMAELAAAVRLSPSYLARLFTARFGTPPMAYLGRMRAERAAALLIETELQVAAIGRMVGWADPNYAARRFRHFFGIGPAAYRARFRSGGLADPSLGGEGEQDGSPGRRAARG